MNKFIYILILSVFFGACTSNTIIKKPENLIPKEQMIDLLTDIFIANGGDNIKNINLQRSTNYFPFVFEKYKIDSSRFRESNYYYTSRIDDYDEILEKVDKRLKALKEQYDNEIKLADSIARVRKDSIKTSKNAIFRESKKIDSLKKAKKM
ncbi:DUF4296 domain-containing protein [Lutibacter sp.]|uniref:DUF4296 domain-containing protein n=1 Tax=Lutibacter sp. TaxID=1925666 RepID=UPI00356628D0